MTDPIYNAINALDDISNGKKVDNKKTMSEDGSKDIENILTTFHNLTEGRATTEARQLPQDFEPDNISPVIGGKEKDHPTKGYFVGGESEYDSGNDASEAVKNAIIRRIAMQHTDLLSKYGPEAVMREVEDEASLMGDMEEIGSSDVSAFVKNIRNNLESSGIVQTQEDAMSDYPSQLGDYIEAGSNGPNKAPVARTDPGSIGPPIKTYKTDDNKEIKIHGNEDDGFRISVKGKPAKSTFSNLDDATNACESYVASKKKQ